jgi:hypothetical protein
MASQPCISQVLRNSAERITLSVIPFRDSNVQRAETLKPAASSTKIRLRAVWPNRRIGAEAVPNGRVFCVLAFLRFLGRDIVRYVAPQKSLCQGPSGIARVADFGYNPPRGTGTCFTA